MPDRADLTNDVAASSGSPSLDGDPAGGSVPVQTLNEQLDQTAQRFGENLALVGNGERLTWAQLRRDSIRFARALRAHGVGPGDHVAIWVANHPDWIRCWLGAVRIGAAAVPFNTRYKADEAAYVIGKSDACLLFIEDTFLGVDFQAQVAEIRDRLPALREVVVLTGEAAEGSVDRETFMRAGDAVAEAEVLRIVPEADAHVIIVFTSGTTGFPKGVMHTNNVVRMVTRLVEWYELGPEDRVLGHLPLFHVAGVFSSFLLAMMSGGALVQLDHWDPAIALELIEREQVSVLSGIPTHFVDLIEHPDASTTNLASLRTGWIGGSFIAPEIVRGSRSVLGMEALLPVYGMTELTSTTTLGRKTDELESLTQGKGVPVDDFEVVVVDPATRRPLPTGTEGEIAVRGYTVMKGYYKEPDANAKVLDGEGWFYTGDLGTFDDAGYLRITGRLSDKFIVGGNNVHPADIENVLREHPAVREVLVLPRPDVRLGEVPVAFVELGNGAPPDEAELIAYAKARLASFKVPRRVVMMDSWPMTPTGKIRRDALREIAVQDGPA